MKDPNVIYPILKSRRIAQRKTETQKLRERKNQTTEKKARNRVLRRKWRAEKCENTPILAIPKVRIKTHQLN